MRIFAQVFYCHKPWGRKQLSLKFYFDMNSLMRSFELYSEHTKATEYFLFYFYLSNQNSHPKQQAIQWIIQMPAIINWTNRVIELPKAKFLSLMTAFAWIFRPVKKIPENLHPGLEMFCLLKTVWNSLVSVLEPSQPSGLRN